MRVLLADDQSEVRSALRLLLEQNPDVEVVGEAARTDDLLAQVMASCPGACGECENSVGYVVLLDWELAHRDAAELPRSLRSLCPYLSVVALSGRPEARQAALAAGADAFVSKVDAPERLLAVIDDCGHADTREEEESSRGGEVE